MTQPSLTTTDFLPCFYIPSFKKDVSVIRNGNIWSVLLTGSMKALNVGIVPTSTHPSSKLFPLLHFPRVAVNQEALGVSQAGHHGLLQQLQDDTLQQREWSARGPVTAPILRHSPAEGGLVKLIGRSPSRDILLSGHLHVCGVGGYFSQVWGMAPLVRGSLLVCPYYCYLTRKSPNTAFYTPGDMLALSHLAATERTGHRGRLGANETPLRTTYSPRCPPRKHHTQLDMCYLRRL